MLAGGIIVAHARVLAAIPPLSRSFAERSERRITSRHFKASPPSPILRTSSQLLCSKTFLAQTIPPATQAMIITNFWSTASGASIMFSVFSHYVGWCVERSWHATVLRKGCGAQLFRFSERAPPPALPIFTSRSGFPAVSCKPVLASSWYDLSNPPRLRALYFCGLKHSLVRYLLALSVWSNFSHWEFWNLN